MKEVSTMLWSKETNFVEGISGPWMGCAMVCEPVLRALPDWFGIEESVVRYVNDVQALPTFLAVQNGQVFGFLTVKIHFPPSAEILVMGVLPGVHRAGWGRKLVNTARIWLKEQGVTCWQVKTLSPSRPCVEYDLTRRFYLAMGFQPLEEIKELWGEENPCLLLVQWIG